MSASPVVALLDVNETLSDLAPLGERFEQVGAPRHLLPTWFASTLRDGIALAASDDYGEFQDVARAVLRGLLAGVPELSAAPEEAADHVLAGFNALSVHPDVPAGIRALHDAGLRIATLTNGGAAIARRLLERSGLDDLVERNLTVVEVRRWKPAPEPYRHACRAMNVAETEAILIAVHPWDIQGAKRAGLRGGWVNRDGRPYPDIFERPDFTGRDLPELARTLTDSTGLAFTAR
jgi:2-haloacid dehalogenase